MPHASRGGRGHREKKPSEKLKETIGKSKFEDMAIDEKRMYPPTYIADLVKASSEVREVEKIPDHIKVTADGESIEYYSLGNHIEFKDKRLYLRAKQDPQSMYFHAAEAPPLYARLSDENHNLCAVDRVENAFTKDMLGKTSELGQHSTKANVFAREGQFFWEAKVVSLCPNPEDPTVPLVVKQDPDKTKTTRGSLRVGFSRREHHCSMPIGSDAYGYAVALNNNAYGSVRFAQGLIDIDGQEYPCPKVDDVIGLMITLPSLEVHKKVVEGTFNSADYPHLKCGPAQPKRKPTTNKKPPKRPKDKLISTASSTPAPDSHPKIRHTLPPPPTHDILRDRNPFNLKGLCYFECPDYTQRPDLMHTATRGKTIDHTTGKPYSVILDPHPNHEIPHLRTLPGSSIEIWVNGQYHGIVAEHLLAFLPPASYIEKSAKATQLHGDVDDGMLGYYPTVSHYGGGAVECKFDGPFWYGYDKSRYPNCRDMGTRYNEQIVEDFVCDLVDEACVEIRTGDKDYMRKEVERRTRETIAVPVPVPVPALAPTAGMGIFTGSGVVGGGSK